MNAGKRHVIRRPRVLVVRLSSLGDILLTQPIIQGMARGGYDVSLGVKPEYAELARRLPGVTDVLLPGQRPDAPYAQVLDLHRTLSSARALSGWGLKPTAAYDKRTWQRRLLVRPGGHPVFWNRWAGLAGRQSVTAWYAQAAAKAGLPADTGAPAVAPTAADRTAAQALRRQAGLDPKAPLALLAPGARWASKRWPAENFIALGRRLASELGFRVGVIGSRDEAELGRQVAQGAGAVDWCGATDLPVLAALMAQADLLVTNDSGPLHLGLAAGACLVVLAGPTVPEFGFLPAGSSRVRVLSLDLGCRPCSLHGGPRCPLGHLRCLRGIGPDQVLEAARQILARPEALKPVKRRRAART